VYAAPMTSTVNWRTELTLLLQDLMLQCCNVYGEGHHTSSLFCVTNGAHLECGYGSMKPYGHLSFTVGYGTLYLGIYSILTMVYNTQNYRGSGLCPSPGIIKNWKTRFGNWMFPFSDNMRKTSTLLGPSERANLSHWTELSSFSRS
jgi:hypothetical protein